MLCEKQRESDLPGTSATCFISAHRFFQTCWITADLVVSCSSADKSGVEEEVTVLMTVMFPDLHQF